jgi:hypothetical protein
MGNVIALRDDGEDLEIEQLEAICCFVRRELLLLIEDALEDNFIVIIKQSVLDTITWQNVNRCLREVRAEDNVTSSAADDERKRRYY